MHHTFECTKNMTKITKYYYDSYDKDMDFENTGNIRVPEKGPKSEKSSGKSIKTIKGKTREIFDNRF